jgi:hypothetical protein
VRNRTLLVDLAIAVFVAILLIAISPGLAVVGLVALLVLIISGLTFAFDRARKRRRADPLQELRSTRASAARSARRAPRPATRSSRRPVQGRPARRPPRR